MGFKATHIIDKGETFNYDTIYIHCIKKYFYTLIRLFRMMK